jgi:hypothetical protein
MKYPTPSLRSTRMMHPRSRRWRTRGCGATEFAGALRALGVAISRPFNAVAIRFADMLQYKGNPGHKQGGALCHPSPRGRSPAPTRRQRGRPGLGRRCILPRICRPEPRFPTDFPPIVASRQPRQAIGCYIALLILRGLGEDSLDWCYHNRRGDWRACSRGRYDAECTAGCR